MSFTDIFDFLDNYRAYNNWTATLTADIDSDDTTISLSSTANLPDKGIVSIGLEHIFYGAIVGSDLTDCVRGYDDSTAGSHDTGDTVELRFNAEIFNNVIEAINSAPDLDFRNPEDLTVSSGVLSPLDGNIAIAVTGEGETDDDVDTIDDTEVEDGEILLLKSVNEITYTNTGNIALDDSLVVPAGGTLAVYYNGYDSQWYKLFSSVGGSGEGATTLAALTDVTLSGVARGDILYRGATKWNNLAAGIAGYALVTGGAAADPSWAALPTQYTNEMAQDAVGGALTDSNTIDFTYNDGAGTITGEFKIANEAAGDLTYRGASYWSRLAKGTDGYFLTTGTTPSWAALPAYANGVEDASKFAISYSAVDQEFTVVVSSGAAYWVQGKRFTPAADTYTGLTAGTGVYYLYYNSSGTLSTGTSLDLLSVCILAYTYDDGAEHGVLFDERHPNTWPSYLHRHLHQSRGAVLISGGTIADYNVDSNADNDLRFSIAETVIEDESLRHTLTPLADDGPYTIWYRTGSDASNLWAWDITATYPFLHDGDDPYYNRLNAGSWSNTAIASNSQWTNYWLCAVNAYNDSGDNYKHRYILIMGQALHTTVASAQAENFMTGISWGTLPFAEIVPLYKITYKRVSDAGLKNVQIDFVTRIADTNVTLISTTNPTLHSTLSGRSEDGQHPASAITADTTNFAVNLSTADDTVQKALDTLDNINIITGSSVTDHAIVRGDGGSKGIQASGITIDDSDNVDGVSMLTFKDATDLEISSDAITITQSIHGVYGESSLDDDLETINGDSKSRLLILYSVNPGYTITLKHGTGNIITPDGNDVEITDNGLVALLNDGSDWRMIAGGGGGGASALGDLTDLFLSDEERGDILFRYDTGWWNLHHGTAGQALITGGHGADPSWGTVGDITSSSTITDNTIVRGDGGSKGIQQTGITVDDNDNVDGFSMVTFKDATELTIATGSITITQSVHKVDGEGDADDDLVTINGTSTSRLLLLYPENAARNITLKSGSGNIITEDGNDYLIPDNSCVMLLYDGSNWRVVNKREEKEFHCQFGPGDSSRIGFHMKNAIYIKSVHIVPTNENIAKTALAAERTVTVYKNNSSIGTATSSGDSVISNTALNTAFASGDMLGIGISGIPGSLRNVHVTVIGW